MVLRGKTAHHVTVNRYVFSLDHFLSCCLIFFKEIHNKITSIGFEDCKVFIHSVDAQSSANGGIIIQVIGEMSNRGEPWRKFVQTFFLAEQPNGYFVLNDIFRFLKDPENDESEPEQATAEAEQVSASPQQQAAPPLSPAHSLPVPLAADIPAPEPVQTASPTPSAAPTEDATPAYEPPATEPHPNGHAQTEEEAPEAPATAAPIDKSPTPEPDRACSGCAENVGQPGRNQPEKVGLSCGARVAWYVGGTCCQLIVPWEWHADAGEPSCSRRKTSTAVPGASSNVCCCD